MTAPLEERLKRLRGSLPASEPGARGLERVARNPGCARLRTLTMEEIKARYDLFRAMSAFETD